jgi:hypothetical protein
MPGSSWVNVVINSLSCSASVNCLLNGISRIRLQIPSSDPSVSGRLLMVSSILPTGLKFTHSPYRGLALIILPPVKNLILASAKRQNQRRFYLLTSGIKPRGAKRSVNKRTSPMVIRRVCAAFSIRCNRSQWAGSMPEVSKVISQRPIGSASIQKNQTTKPLDVYHPAITPMTRMTANP